MACIWKDIEQLLSTGHGVAVASIRYVGTAAAANGVEAAAVGDEVYAAVSCGEKLGNLPCLPGSRTNSLVGLMPLQPNAH